MNEIDAPKFATIYGEINERLAKGELFKIDHEITKAVRERSVTDPDVAEQEYTYILDFLNKGDNPKILDNVGFIITNFGKLFKKPDDYILSMLFEHVVPQQTAEQFQALVTHADIDEKILAGSIYNENYSELEHLVKFDSEDWKDTEKGYAEYLAKISVVMERIREGKIINPTWIDFILNQIKDKDVGSDLVHSLTVYFKRLEILDRFRQHDWQEWQLKQLTEIGVLQVAYMTRSS